MLDRKQSDLCTGRGSYAVILLVSPLGSLTIAKFNGMSVHCFVVHVALFSVYYFQILFLDYCTWTIYVSVTILRKYSGDGCACASSRYQAIFLLPRGLGMKLGLIGPKRFTLVGGGLASIDRCISDSRTAINIRQKLAGKEPLGLKNITANSFPHNCTLPENYMHLVFSTP